MHHRKCEFPLDCGQNVSHLIRVALTVLRSVTGNMQLLVTAANVTIRDGNKRDTLFFVSLL
jgi:hypothetical protein